MSVVCPEPNVLVDSRRDVYVCYWLLACEVVATVFTPSAHVHMHMRTIDSMYSETRRHKVLMVLAADITHSLYTKRNEGMGILG